MENISIRAFNPMLTNPSSSLRGKSGLNSIELMSIRSAMAYAANAQDTDEATVRSILTTAFGVDDVEDLSPDNYDDVIRFLIDLNVKAILN